MFDLQLMHNAHGIMHMVKSGLENCILTSYEPSLRYQPTGLANPAFLAEFPAVDSSNSEGATFHDHFKPKMVIHIKKEF